MGLPRLPVLLSSFAFTAVWAALVTATLTLTPTSASALSSAEAECHDEIAKAATRYAGATTKLLQRCHQKRSSGKLPLATDCNSVAGADADNRLGSTRSRALGDILEACGGDEAAVLALYETCPAPAAGVDDSGATTDIDDFTEVALCLFALTDSHAAALAEDAQGNPAERLLDPLRNCQGALGKGTARVVRSYMRERRRCQSAADRLGGDGTYVCNSSDGSGRIQKSLDQYASKTTPACTFQEDVLERIGACDDDTAGLVACSSSSASVHGAALIRNAYSLSASSATTTTTTMEGETTTTTLVGTGCGSTFPECNGPCPLGTACTNNGSECTCEASGTGPCADATIIRQIISRYSTEVDSNTSLNAGWSGLAFDLDVPNRSQDMVDVSCDENCENCEVSLHREPDGTYYGCNCTANPDVACGVINGSDAARCGSIDPTCRCYFGAPLPIAASGIPACVPMRLRSSNAGTMNLRTGEWSDIIDLAAVVYLGLESTAPCPTCVGDPVANDNVRGGTCTGGLSSGACDANGTHPTYGTTSNDCLPASAANISGTGLLIRVPLTTGQSQLNATLPCDTPEGELCHCRTCTGNGLKSCNNDAECAALGAGTCTASGGAGVVLNTCDGFACSANGTCTTGPVDFYCDGAVFPDGSGYIPCQSNSDCGGANGACTLPRFRRCFPSPTIFDGTPAVYDPESVSTFCTAPTSNPAINIGAGLPGPGALLLKWDNDIRCRSNPDVEYEFPSGANCEANATTTTTLLPLPECEDAESPVCGGLCPVGSVCTDNAGVCACTGLPLPSCDDATAPACGGICPTAGEICQASGDTCACQVVTLPQCDSAAAPLCGGLCPTGEICQSVGESCECGAPGVPACTSALSPTCGGLCDIGQACVASNDTCSCLQLPVPTCAEATAPLCAGTCAIGSLCQDAGGGACQCTLLPIP
jgi:hypothetical protein